jgi:non-specific serine/threonine protein kinase
MLFFSSFTKHLDLYKEILTNDNQKYSYLTGQLTPKEREKNIARFREEPDNHTFLISLKAGGVGLNLTEASYVFMLDPWWNPQAENQAIARAHRIGQDKTVIALKFITRNSIEEKILKLQERKSQLAADILESAESLQLTKQELQELIN